MKSTSAKVSTKNDPRLEREKATVWLREQGAEYIRAVWGVKSGWWREGKFLGSRSVEAMENSKREGRP